METLEEPLISPTKSPGQRSEPVGGNANGARHGRTTLKERLLEVRWKLLVVSLIFAMIAGMLRWWVPLQYASTVVLLVDEGLGPLRPEARSVLEPANLAHVYYEATSTRVIDHLIDSFALQAHYHIPSDLEHGRVLTAQRLLDNIDPHYLDAQCMSITVWDNNADTALAIANALHGFLRQKEQADATAAQHRSVSVYNDALRRTEQRSVERTQQLTTLLAEKLLARDGSAGADREIALQRATDLIMAAQLPVVELQRELDMASALLSVPQGERVSLVRAPLRDTGASRSYRSISAAVLAFPVVLIILCAIIIVWHFHGHEFHAWLHARPDRPAVPMH